jgi:hypothetical protein
MVMIEEKSEPPRILSIRKLTERAKKLRLLIEEQEPTRSGKILKNTRSGCEIESGLLKCILSPTKKRIEYKLKNSVKIFHTINYTSTSETSLRI